MAIITTEGFVLMNYLNTNNFQPGKFFVILDKLSENYKVFYVVSEKK